MKKLFFTIVALLSFSLFIQAAGWDVNYSQTSNGKYQLDFSVSDFSLTDITINEVTYSKILFDHSIVSMQKGFAELPYLNASLILDARNNVSLEVIPGEYQEFQLDYPMLPSRGTIYRDKDPSQVPYEISPKSIRDTWYPAELATITDPFIIRDFRGASVYVNPFQYNAASNTLRVYSSLTVELIENSTPSINPLNTSTFDVEREMDPIYSSVFINYNQNRDDLTIGEYGDILVITTDRDESAIQPFIDWKMEKGYNVSLEVVSTGTNVVSMIQDAYDANNDLLYVQIVGDWEDIKTNLLSGYAPMDPQAGCVIGTDDYADIAIGRFSAGSPSDVTVQVNKVIAYEQTPDMGDWYSTSTGVASSEGSGIGDDGEIDYDHIQIIYDDKLNPSLGYDYHHEIYEPGASANDVSNAVNNGTSIINYCGHGSETSWGTTGFSNSNVAQLSNGNKLPFVISVACVNGAFNGTTCFAEAWTRKENGGAIMFLGGTINQPWTPPMRGQDYMNDIFTGGYNYDDHPGQSGINTEEQRTTLGTIVFNGLTLMCVESGGGDDWETAKTWTLFGDASLQPRSETPNDINLSNETIMAGVPFTTIVSGPDGVFEGAMVCISNGSEYFSAISDASGNVTINHTLTPGSAKLTVTGFNLATIYEDVVVASSDEAWIIVNNFETDDSNGNNNGQIDYNEDILLAVDAENVGSVNANGISATLSTVDEYITITDDSFDYGDINAGQVVDGVDAFAFSVAETIPDNYSAMFTIEFSDGSKSLWTGNIPVTLHAPVLDFNGYTLDDSNGNGNGKFDAGETVDFILEVMNNGSADAMEVMGDLITSDVYITIESSSMTYGDLGAGESATQIFTVSSDPGTPEGHYAAFMLQIGADYGYTGMGDFTEVIGQIPVVIIDLDPNGGSGDQMEDAMAENGIIPENVDAFPDDLGLYTTAFVCLGIYSDNHTLSETEGQLLAEFLNNGGKLYMEGGDTWAFDSQTEVHGMFNINGTEDGSSDMGTVNGITGTFTEGMSFNYSGENNWMDHLAPIGSAFSILENQSPSYFTAVAYDAGDYKTIGASHEFGGLGDETQQAALMLEYLNFFGIDMSLQAAFTADDPTISVGESVHFHDISNGIVDACNWVFEGGTPATSTDADPIITYNTVGSYDVTLTVTNGDGSSTITIEDYVIVSFPAGIENVDNTALNIYPNPNNGQFSINFNSEYTSNASIKVFNTYGVQVYENVTENTNNLAIDLSTLDNGVYYLIIENDNNRVVKQVVIR